MNKSLEVGVANGPAGGREGVLVMADPKLTVMRGLCWVRYLTVDQEDFLMNLETEFVSRLKLVVPGSLYVPMSCLIL